MNSDFKKNRKLKNRRIFSMVLLVAIIFSVFAFIVFGLRSLNLIRLPYFIEALFYPDKGSGNELSFDDAHIYDALKKYAEENSLSEEENLSYQIIRAEITADNLREFLSALTPPEKLYAESSFTHRNGKTVRNSSSVLRKNGENFSYVQKNPDGSQETYIINKRKNFEYYKNSATNSIARNPLGNNFNYSSLPNVFLIGEYINILGNNGAIANDFQIIRGENENILKFTYLVPLLLLREEYVLNLDAGIATEINSYRNEELIYTYTSSLIITSGEELEEHIKNEWFDVKE